MWPVSVSFSCPVATSQILIVRSAEPVQNHSLLGSNASDRTHLAGTAQVSMGHGSFAQRGFLMASSRGSRCYEQQAADQHSGRTSPCSADHGSCQGLS